ncbi:MAG: lytic transglycosylase domain-containing protein [Clostridia bacterium]
MKRRKKVWVLLCVLMVVLLVINSQMIWKWMYPIKYHHEIMQASERYTLDPHLIVAIIRTESNFQPDRVSRKGALGLMQIMPDTADWVIRQAGFKQTTLDDLWQPERNIEIGSWYLAYLLAKFEGKLEPAIAAYNAGPGKVNSWLDQKLWDGSRDSLENIPYGETRHYVQRVLYYHERYDQVYNERLE